jgi:hypothetical protein
MQFLDVDDSYSIEPIEANPTVRVRSPRLHELVVSVYFGRSPATRAVKRAAKALIPRRLRGKALKTTQRRVIFGNPRSPDAEFTLELRRRFKGEVVALSEYLGRDLVSLWGYDAVD